MSMPLYKVTGGIGVFRKADGALCKSTRGFCTIYLVGINVTHRQYEFLEHRCATIADYVHSLWSIPHPPSLNTEDTPQELKSITTSS